MSLWLGRSTSGVARAFLCWGAAVATIAGCTKSGDERTATESGSDSTMKPDGAVPADVSVSVDLRPAEISVDLASTDVPLDVRSMDCPSDAGSTDCPSDAGATDGTSDAKPETGDRLNGFGDGNNPPETRVRPIVQLQIVPSTPRNQMALFVAADEPFTVVVSSLNLGGFETAEAPCLEPQLIRVDLVQDGSTFTVTAIDSIVSCEFSNALVTTETSELPRAGLPAGDYTIIAPTPPQFPEYQEIRLDFHVE